MWRKEAQLELESLPLPDSTLLYISSLLMDSANNKPISHGNTSSITSAKPISKNDDNNNATSASLLHRLAGPSTGKAGLSKDQTEITRVIAEASEGSKFYQASGKNTHGVGWLLG